MMTLSEYLKREQITQGAFARQINTSQAHVSRLTAGSLPSMKTALRIQEATAGKVPVSAWKETAKVVSEIGQDAA
jgi:transcriptional regulator with XRE-family HTH domain